MGLRGNQSLTQREGGSWASCCQPLNYLWVPEDIPKQDTGFFHCHGIFRVSPQQSTHWLMVPLCPWCHLSGAMNIPWASRAQVLMDTVRPTAAFPSSPGILLFCIHGIPLCSSPPAGNPHSGLFQTPSKAWMEVSVGDEVLGSQTHTEASPGFHPQAEEAIPHHSLTPGLGKVLAAHLGIQRGAAEGRSQKGGGEGAAPGVGRCWWEPPSPSMMDQPLPLIPAVCNI